MTEEQKNELLELLNEAEIALAEGDTDTVKDKIEDVKEIVRPLPGTGSTGDLH